MRMMRIKGSQFKGHTVSEALKQLEQLAADTTSAGLLKKAFIVVRNGDLVMPTDYESELISEDDEIIIMPLFAGG